MTPDPVHRQRSQRAVNRVALLRAVHLKGPLSRSQLGQEVSLTRSTIAAIVSELAVHELVEESGSIPSLGRGRPSTIVAPNPRNVVVAMEFMVDRLGVAVVALGGTVLSSTWRHRDQRDADPATLVQGAVRIAQRVLAGLPEATRLHGIGIGVPGLISHRDERVILAPNLLWENVDLGELLAEHFADIPITIDNEANLGALAESRRGISQGHNHAVYLSTDVGVGAGIITNGVLNTGTDGFAGEVGHMPINPLGKTCACGAIGCFETEVSTRALLQRLGRNGLAAGWTVAEDILRDVREGDQVTLQGLAEHADWLAFGLAGLIHLLNVDMVVLGGLLGELLPVFETQLEASLRPRLLPSMRNTPIVASQLGQDAVLLGSAERVWDVVIDSINW